MVIIGLTLQNEWEYFPRDFSPGKFPTAKLPKADQMSICDGGDLGMEVGKEKMVTTYDKW